MDNTSDKKPLLSSNSSQVSGEGSNSKKDSKKDSKEESKSETKKESKKELENETPPVSGGGETKKEAPPTPHRIVRPTVQARPFSTRTKGLYWIFTILHLIVLLSVLFAISYGLLQFVFAQTKNGPLYWGAGSFIGGVPSIMFEPITPNATVIKNRKKIIFNPKLNDTFRPYVNRLKNLTHRGLSEAEEIAKTNCTQIHQNLTNEERWMGNNTELYCLQNVSTTLPKNDTDRVCDPEYSENMGYDEARPCILIRLTKLRGFFPKNDEQRDDERPANVAKNPCDSKIEFDCTAQRKGNDTVLEMIAGDGIPFCHFPFWNQKGYMPPYIMIQPKEAFTTGETVIYCKPKLESLRRLSNLRKNKVEIVVQIED